MTALNAVTGRFAAPIAAGLLILALTGCSRLGAHGADVSTVAPAAGTVASSAPSAPAAGSASADATLNSITADLGSASTANDEADSNASAGDQAAATNDDQ